MRNGLPASSPRRGIRFAPTSRDRCVTDGQRLLSPRQAAHVHRPLYEVSVGMPAHVALTLLEAEVGLLPADGAHVPWQVTITPVNLPPGDAREALRHLLSLLGALPACNCPECRGGRAADAA